MKLLILLFLLTFCVYVHAGTFNPCEYANLSGSSFEHLDTGHDSNFERQKQWNNQQLVLACQQYQLRLLENAKENVYNY